MSKIGTKTISKTSHNLMKKVEKELLGAGEIYIDKTINRKVEKEISHLGKEKLLVDHVYKLTKKYNKANKNKILFLLVRLYNYNKQVHESLIKELKNDKLLLNKRIKTRMDKKKAHKDIYKKLLEIANKHYNVVKNYAENFNPKKKYLRSFILNIVYHKRKAEAIYKVLTNIGMRKTLHKVLLKKLDSVYKALVEFTFQLANMITSLVKDIKNNKVKSISKKAKEIRDIVSNKIEILRDFAYKYTYNIIHEEKFYDFDNNKLVLITKNVKSASYAYS